MASRKRKPDSPQIGLSFAGPSLPTPPAPMLQQSTCVTPSSDSHRPDRESADFGSNPTEPLNVDLDSFDDYDEQKTHDDVPRIRLADPPHEVSVIVEAIGDRFEVSRLRNNGTTVACVFYTRKELEELVSHAQAALEIG